MLNPKTFHLSFFLLLLITTTTTYTPTDYFLLNCGSSSNTTSSDGRNWDGDSRSKFSPSNIADISTSSMASKQAPSVTQVPYMTARIIRSQFTYTFPVSAGPKFVRLYFYPSTYSDFDKSNSFFSVMANDYTLLSNFSASLSVDATSVPFLIKEFIINVKSSQRLDITFSPSQNSSAFINGIEVVSIPNNHYIRGSDYRIPYIVNQIDSFYINSNTALETINRLNVGGNEVPITSDTAMFRPWFPDNKYIFGAAFGLTPQRNIPIHYSVVTPNYTAPEVVYTTSRTMGKHGLQYNLTWFFPVDSGFYYLLRLHFCEIQLEVTSENQRVFMIYINNQTAQRDADVIDWSHGREIPVFKDYVVFVTDPDGRGSKQDLWLAMHPDMESKPQFADALLNGLEIFKLNRSDGSLAGPNPEPLLIASPPQHAISVAVNTKRKRSRPAAIAGGIAGGIVVMLLILGFLIFRRKKLKDSGPSDAKSSWIPLSSTSRSTKKSDSSLPSDLCRRFSLADIKIATGDFDENFIIGVGGFGKVYKGYIDNGATTVAIKRLNPSSNQGVHEFETEIMMLSKLRHLHLVSLIGYSDDNGEMILVYDYMARGTLRDHLYKTENPPLPWKQRLKICIGTARGLHYLHTGAKRTIIHRDVKSTNILLDEKWVAKVSDFGLSKLGPKDVGHTHVSTVVKGSLGYVDPEYYRRQQLTEKSDVYSFGVVLLEMLCARTPIIPSLPKEQVNLAEWARFCYRKGTLDQIIDANLRGKIAAGCLGKFGEVAYSCLRDKGIERPTMNDVVWGLEFALQLQEAAEKIGQVMGTCEAISLSPSAPLLRLHREVATTTDDDDEFSGSKSSGTSASIANTSNGGLKSENVFSEFMNATGR